MPLERDFLFAGFLGNGKNGFARDKRLQLDEVRAALLQLVDRTPAVFGSCNRDRTGKARLGPIQHRTGGHDARSQHAPAFNLVPPGLNGCEVAAHVANAGDAVGNEKWQGNFLSPREPIAKNKVHVHVPQTGNQKRASAVQNYGSVARITSLLAGADRGDAVPFNDDDLVRMDFAGPHVDDIDVGDDRHVLKRPILASGRPPAEKQKQEEGPKHTEKSRADSHGQDCIEEREKKRESRWRVFLCAMARKVLH